MTVKQSILVVDDRSQNLLALERTLADTEAELVRATSGEEALAATLDRDFALAILDVQMPGMDGYELAELLLGDPKTRHVPIIFLTAVSGEEEQIFKGYGAGAVDYIVKPYHPAILTSKVNVFLELDRHKRENQRQRELLEAANRELTDFAHSASHDLQAPLRTISAFASILAEELGDELSADADKYLHRIVEGATRMKRLIDGLLEYSRAGRHEAPLARVDVGAIVESVLLDLEAVIRESEAEVVVCDLPSLVAEPLQLGQLFSNLISNALKFRGEASPRILISTELTDQGHAVSVQDNGIGLDPKFADRVFRIFHRLHGQDEYEGTGIGLAICKKIVERHGGKIWVESIPGQGATFRFTIAADARAEQTRAP